MRPSPSQGEGCCLPHRPWVVRLGGSPVAVGNPSSFNGVVFTPENPCGATVDAPITTQTPLVVIARYGGCVGARQRPGCPLVDRDGQPVTEDYYEDGDMALVRSSILGLQGDHNPAVRPPFNSCTPGVQSSAPEVKLSIKACGMPEAVIIDSDSELVVPAGPITIDVLTPEDWFVGQGPEGSVETTNLDCDLRVTACPCSCAYVPHGVLTEFLQVDAANLERFILVRPRRARALSVSNTVAGSGASQNGLVQYHLQNNPAAFGATLFQGGFPLTVEPFGAAPFLSISPPAGIADHILRWAIV
jgi:hypothetical protein